MNTINTGIYELDEMLNGGIPENSITALTGPPGSGKTILSLQFLYTNLKQGKKCIYMSFTSTEEELVINALNYGWDLTPYLENKRLIIEKIELTSLNLNNSESHIFLEYINTLPEFISMLKADLVVIDSITEFLMLFRNDFERKMWLFKLFQIMKSKHSTALLTAETDVDFTNSRFEIVELLADGIISMRRIQYSHLAELVHIIHITKMRWVKHSRKIGQYNITDAGIEVSTNLGI
jgi:flagellar protein FlaH